MAANPKSSRPRTGPARAIFEIDHEDYPDAPSAIEAALKNCPRFKCKECGRERFGNWKHCKKCGNDDFRRIPGENDE